MYTLRTIENGIENNQTLGNGYSVINRIENPEEFAKMYNAHYGSEDGKLVECTNDLIYSIVEGEKGMILLNKERHYYIMTENGRTFSNISFK